MSLPQPTVEIGFPSGAATSTTLYLNDTAKGVLNTNTLAGDVWVNVKQWLVTFETRRGATRVEPILSYEASTATVTLRNEDRRFDPTNLAGPYVDGVTGKTEVTPGRPIRIYVQYGANIYYLFRGFIDGWKLAYEGPTRSTATVTATDGMKLLAGADRIAGSSVGAGELSSARIGRILDSAGWPTYDRIINTGSSTLQATVLEGDALTELQLTAATEGGEFYIDGAGRAYFRGRSGPTSDSRSTTSQATFGSNQAGGELPYIDVDLDYDEAQLSNPVRFTRAGGTAQTAEDTALQTLYQNGIPRVFERTDLLMQTDAAALDYAQWVLYQNKEPELRVSSITVDPRPDQYADLLYPQVLGREIGDRITVKRRPPGGGAVSTQDGFVRGIQHSFGPGPNRWKTTWTLQSATKYAFLVLNDSVLGKLNENALGFG